MVNSTRLEAETDQGNVELKGTYRTNAARQVAVMARRSCAPGLNQSLCIFGSFNVN